MEMLKKLDENTLTDEEGYEKLTEKLTVYSEKLYKDVLTGAYNRRYFEEKVKNMSLNAGVAVIDLDDFKLFNDTYGHDGGDLVLTTVVKVIRHYIRRTDILVRYGGDEFVILIPRSLKEAMHILEEFRRCVQYLKIPYDLGIDVSVTLGVCAYPEITQNYSELIKSADKALLRGKEEGKNRIIVASKEDVLLA